MRTTPPRASASRETHQYLAVHSFLFFFRGWDKLVAVLFHGQWTQESQHAVSLMESLAHQHHQPEQQGQERHRPESSSGRAVPDAAPAALDRGTSTAAETLHSETEAAVQRARGDFQVLLAEANVMSLIDVRGRAVLSLRSSCNTVQCQCLSSSSPPRTTCLTRQIQQCLSTAVFFVSLCCSRGARPNPLPAI